MNMEHTQQHTQGRVHTVDLMLLSEKGADMQRNYHRDSRVTGKERKGMYKGFPICYLRFDPNTLKVYSKQTNRYLKMGNCESHADFRLHLNDWGRVEVLPPEAIALSRTDFSVDYMVKEGADDYRQMCDMLILAFNAKHDVPEKDQYYGETQTTMKHKNNKTKWGPFEIECYYKPIQTNGSPVEWRLELRYQSKMEKECKLYRDVLPMLDELRTELRTLPDYYEKAQNMMNTTLVNKFEESRAGSGGTVRLNEFIFLNRDRVFSWKQLQDLFSRLGSDDPKNATRNYHRPRKAHTLITKKKFAKFISIVDSMIESWVKNNTELDEFFEARNGEKTNSLMIEPY